MRLSFLRLLPVLVVLPSLPGARPTPATIKPNVVFILADDLGWSDTTVCGQTKLYRTPNLERLASRGMLYTRAYSASPLCSPTRASIMTGLSPARVGITAPVCHLPTEKLKATVREKAPPNAKALILDSATRLDTRYHTLAEAFKAAGYATAHFGKWHLGPEPYSPLQQGFDVDRPHWPGPGPAGSYVAPWKFPAKLNFPPRTPDEHIEDRMAGEAVAWMEKNQARPFFMNYWQFSVHAPFDAKQSLIDKYRRRIDPADPQRSPTYAAMVESMDDAVGRLLDTIDRLGLADRTIVVFFSDNGGNMYNTIDDTSPTSNAPLRGGKATVYEGGTRVPCIVSWPGRTAPGSRSDTIVQSMDFYPTFVELLGLEPPSGQIFDGISIADTFKGRPLSREAIFTYFPHSPRVPDALPPAVTVTTDEWKLIRVFHEGNDGVHAYRLYNLKQDLGETRDLSAEHPGRVQAMDALIEKFLQDTKAITPRRNPAYDPRARPPPPPGRHPAARPEPAGGKRQKKGARSDSDV